MYKISDWRGNFRCCWRVLAPIIASFLLFPALVHAIDLRVGRTVSIPAGEVVHQNVYAVANQLTVSGDVNGDVVAAGGQMVLDGNLNGDVTAAGGQVHINGKVAGDVRMLAGQMDLSGSVGGDLVVAGGQVRIHPGAAIGGDVLVAGGVLILEGSIGKSLRAAGENITLNGKIVGPIRARVGQLIVGDHAQLSSGLTYLSPDQAEISEGADIAGPVQFYVVSGMDQDWFQRGLRRLGFAFYFLGLLMTLAAGLLACTLLRRISQDLVRYALPNFGKELLRGFILFFVIPAAVFLLFVTVVGVPFAFLAGLTHLSFGVIAIVFTGIAEGAWVLRRVLHKDAYEVNWKTALVGVPLAFVVSLVPFGGFVINTLFFLVIFGSLYERFWILIRSSAVKSSA